MMSSKTRRCPSRTAVTLGSTGKPPRSRLQATRVPEKSRSRDREKPSPDSEIVRGERGSGPEITPSIRAASRTVRAIGPSVESVDHAAWTGHEGTLPREGLKPTTSQKEAGLRREPPMSLPSAIGTIPQARAAAAPPLEPPQVLVVSYGLRVSPNTSL